MTLPAARTARRPRPVTPLSILASKLDSLSRQAALIPALEASFVEMLADATRLANGLDPYLKSCTTPESEPLSQLARQTNDEDWAQRFTDGETSVALEPEMLSGHIEGQFLKCLVHAMKATRILEIGLFTGYSALAMAEALPPTGKLVACERDAFAAGIARQAFARSGFDHKLHVELGPALGTLPRLAAERQQFDLIFIDADKGNYANYFRLVLDGELLASNGLICVDNTLMQGQPYASGEMTENGRAIADFNRAVMSDPRVETVLLPLRDGVTLIRRC